MTYDVVAALATVGAVVLYFTGLDRQSLWLDELYSATSSTGGLSELIEFWLWDRHPPVYGLLLWAWSALFGTGEAALRALSATAAAVTVAATYLVGRRVLPGRIVATTTVLLAGSTTVLVYAQEVRVYAMLLLASTLATLTWLSALRAARTPGGRGIRGIHWPFALAGLFAASLHYYGAALVVFQLAYLTVVAIRVGGLRAVPILSGLIALGPPAVELTLHLPYLLSGLGSNWIQEPDLSLVKNLIGFQLNSNVAWLATILVVPLASLTSAGRRNASRHVSDVVGDTETRRHLIDLAYLAVVPIGVLAASSSIVPTLIARNSIIVLPAVTILLAWWLALAPHACGARLPVFATVLVAVPLAGFLPEYVKPHKQQWREVAYEVVARADADTLLAVLGSVDALEDVTLASNDALRSWLWRHYLESAGADYERSPFRETMQFADRPPAVQQVVERAKALGRSRLLLVYAHWPPMSVEAMDTLRDLAVSVEHVALKRAGLYDVQLR